MSGALFLGYHRLQAQQAPPQLMIEKVKEDLYSISGDGGNVGVLVTSQGIILVDDKFARDSDEIIKQVRTISALPIRYVLNTHFHGDHTGGNKRFLSDNAEIIAHKNARANMMAQEMPGAQRVTFTDETSLWLGGTEVRMRYFGRGHTNGDAIVYFPQLKTIHGGDLFTRGAPFIDYKGGGSVKEWTGTLQGALDTWDFDTAIPGHGPVGSRADLMKHIQNITTFRTRAYEQIAKGVTKEQLGDQIKIDDLGWTPSNLYKGAMPSVYDELAGKK